MWRLTKWGWKQTGAYRITLYFSVCVCVCVCVSWKVMKLLIDFYTPCWQTGFYVPFSGPDQDLLPFPWLGSAIPATPYRALRLYSDPRLGFQEAGSNFYAAVFSRLIFCAVLALPCSCTLVLILFFFCFSICKYFKNGLMYINFYFVGNLLKISASHDERTRAYQRARTRAGTRIIHM
jgi:hypothetical protein